jgi:hypothetical protein
MSSLSTYKPIIKLEDEMDIFSIYNDGTLTLSNVCFTLGVFNKMVSMFSQKILIVENLIIEFAHVDNHVEYDLTKIVEKIMQHVDNLCSLVLLCDFCMISKKRLPEDDKNRYYSDRIDLEILFYHPEKEKHVDYVYCKQPIEYHYYVRILFYITKKRIEITLTKDYDGGILGELKTILSTPRKITKNTVVGQPLQIIMDYKYPCPHKNDYILVMREYKYFHLVNVLLNRSHMFDGVDPLIPLPTEAGHVALFRLICDYALESIPHSMWDDF